MYLGWLRFHSLYFSSDEAIQHRLKQVDHQRDFRFILGPCQCVHFVMVTLHQVFVPNFGLLMVKKHIKSGKYFCIMTLNYFKTC